MATPPEPVPAAIRPSVERRIVTVLFADLVGFTPLSERLDAEDVAAVQDAYFASVRETIERYGGVLEKFIGDAAMAVFGAPHGRDDDAERAVRAGLALIAAVEQLGARLGLGPGELQLRVGVNSGEVVHATDGPDAGRVTGDTVNTAARLQAAARPNAVLVGPLTALTVRAAIELTDAGPIELKGKTEPVAAWEVDRIRAEPSRDAALGGLRAPLLGRDEELARLTGLARGRIAVIAPPGVGKSRLVAETAARLEAGGRRVLRARVRPQSASPYEAVGQLLLAAGDELERALGSLPARRREVVAREVEALLRPAGGGSEPVEREARFSAWSDALDALDAAAAWIVEDVHWAGPDLLAFLEHATHDRRLVIATARPSLLDSAADWVASGEQLELATLPRTDATALVAALVGDALPQELVLAIAERSDGNPLFIEELLRTWISVGTLSEASGGWELTVRPDSVSLPPTVQAIYAAQLDDLPADARLVARRASVAGRRFPQAALPALELEGLEDGLDVLRRRAFVAGPQPDLVSGVVYAYRHALLRDAGYASLARVERARLHAALARWLEETAGERPAEVAQLVAEHYAAAAESVPAIGAPDGLVREALAEAAATWFERAAQAALGMSAPAAAVRLLDRSIELTDADATLDLARRRMRRGEVLATSAELDAGIDDVGAAMEAFTNALPEEHALYGEAAYRLGLGYMQQIRFPEAEELSRTAVARLADLDDPAASARLMALHAWSVAAQGRDEGAGDEARRARELGASVDDLGLQVDVLEHFAATMDELGGDIRVWAELEELARAAGRWRQAVVAARIRAQMSADTDPLAAMPLLVEATELAEAHGQTEQIGWTNLSRAETLFVIGDWDAALEAGERAIALGERYAYERLTFRTWMVVLPILAARADPSWLERYDAWWHGAISHFPAVPSPYAIVLRAATAQWLARARGEPPPADIVLPDTTPPFSNPHFLAAREVVAEALIATDQLERAVELASFEPEDDWTDLMRASQALIGAWVARASGADPAAAAGEAAARARRIGARWWIERAESFDVVPKG